VRIVTRPAAFINVGDGLRLRVVDDNALPGPLARIARRRRSMPVATHSLSSGSTVENALRPPKVLISVHARVWGSACRS